MAETKDSIIELSDVDEFNIPKCNLIPFYVTEEGARYSWSSSNHYLLKGMNGIDDAICSRIEEKYTVFDASKTKKKPPVLIMPRGIGARHFCCYNSIEGYSASCVDVYSANGTELTDEVLRLWLYMNSSLFWLIREIAGRKNLGGGMLKAEAVDIKSFAIYFKFEKMDEIKRIFETASNSAISNATEEINSKIHNEIDDMVFDFLGISKEDRDYIRKQAVEVVEARYTKTKNK